MIKITRNIQMEAIVQREALHGALELAFIALDSKAEVKGHSYILFTEDSNRLRVSAFSPDTTISILAETEEIESGFEAALPGKTLKEVFRKLKGAKVTLKTHEHKTSLRCGRATFKFNVLSREFFPKLPDTQSPLIKELEVSNLLTGFQKVSFSIGNDDNRANLKGVHIDAENYTASDSFRMSIFSSHNIDLGKPFSLSRISTMKIVKLLKRLNGLCRVSLSGSGFVMETDEVVLTARTLALRYPRYQDAIPKGECGVIIFDKHLVREALERLLVVTDNDEVVEFSIKEGLASIQAKATGGAMGQEFLECEFPSTVKFKLNGRFLLDVVDRLDEDTLNIEVRKDRETGAGPMPYPLVVKEGSYVNLIMPRRF
jgi:DNA polymerase III sliding clamp (beta) subunit (PCNA family)